MAQYEWKNIDFPATLKDWNKFEQDNKTIALNICLFHTILNK